MMRALFWVGVASVALVGCDCGGDGTDRIGVDAEVGPDGGGSDASGVDAATPDGGEVDAEVSDGGMDPDGGEPMRVCDESETCDNGLDDDCDGTVEEGCTCTPGDTATCFSGDPAGRNVGQCGDGTMLCEGSFEFGEWGPCEGERTESPEMCDVAGLDENCNGAANEDCECVAGDPPLPCGSDVGECVAGVQNCVTGRRTACEGATGPATELCDGLDNDCDGSVDESLTRLCGTDVGACSFGTEACTAGVWGACEGGTAAGTESCDGTDDDCDGSVDEGVTRNCGTDVGACGFGTEVCSGGTFGSCTGSTGPSAETCNGSDDDCDGSTDEALSRRCGSTDVGACAYGTETCGGGSWSSCSGAIEPATEVCDGAIDEDCDGTVDEGCTCTDGATRPCGSDTGACVAGTETCSGGDWGSCTGETGPIGESCNGADDDCDGSTDESLTRSCGSTDVGVCMRGTETCGAGSWGSCVGSVEPGAELCDGILDENCDGAVDEGCTCITGAVRSCGSDTGACVAGTETCDASGNWGACTGATGPTVESCNGSDDDCDGATDEALVRTCGTNVGECVAGTESCSSGSWGACTGATGPSTELCDGANDENCDGAVDEGCACTEGEMRACGSNVGACMPGSQTCDATGTWGACSGETGPSAELCDGAVDQDCDGVIDEGCDCVTGATRRCGNGTGACVRGTETCDAAGQWGACLGGTGPTGETCNGDDDDCDGTTDEMLVRSCGSDLGACVAGTETCSAGSWGSCSGSTGPMSELCDGSVDEDCDGAVDEGCLCTDGQTRSCGSATGACVQGTETCDLMGVWGSCTGSTGPTSESCNGDDDDCDGATDEMLVRSCGTDVGACSEGTETCAAGSWGSCTGATGPSAELCDGSIDENCDGSVDEGCLCTNGQMRACGSSVGECEEGTETCDLSGTWSACVGETGPGTEVCNGLDDNCDGNVDEGGVCQPPTLMCPGASSTVAGDAVTLMGSGSDPDGGSVMFMWTVISAPLGSSAVPASPTSANTDFTPDEAGSYTLRLCVTDDEGEMACCTTTVMASSSCTPPAAPTLTVCPTSWDRRPVVQFDPLPTGEFYELYRDMDAAPYAVVTMDGQNYHRPTSELDVGSAPPGTGMDIYARACLDSDPTCCVTSTPVSVNLIESCTTPIAPSATNVLFSEYVINGDGMCSGPDCEAGEAFEVTNLSHCPVALDGNHFAYCNNSSCSNPRWMNFGASDVVPPRGVYVAIRNQAASMCSYPFFGTVDPGLYGLNISALVMEGSNLASGWFSNGASSGSLRVASGAYVDDTSGTTFDIISPYSTSAGECSSIGFNAYGECGEVSPAVTPSDVLTPNQLGRLWHPCDAVTSPVPASCM